MPRRPLLVLVSLLIVAPLLPAAVSAKAPPPDPDYQVTYHPELTVSRAAGAIAIDGALGDPGWNGAARAAGFAEHNPGDQVQPPVDTEVFVTYDDEYLYIAYHCYDDPAKVRATMCERDAIFSDDYIITAIDTYGDQSWAYEISANPLGVQGDLLWSSNYGEDGTFEMVYESAGRIVDDGWIVEMAIPFSSMRFPDVDEQVWRMDFWRNHPREVRGQYSWAAYDRDDPCWPCKWGTVRGISGVKPGKGLEILPTFVATQSGSRGDDGEFDNDDVKGEPSLGVKYALSSAFTVEATVNPDFSQIESDEAQIDVNSTVALFYPERRPFFQEGSDLFHSFFNAVYTRTVNAPTFAAKLTGRPGRTNVAYLVARDEHTPYIVPFEEQSGEILGGESVTNILRARHALGDQSHLGFLATDRRLDGGGAGTLMSADMRLRLTRNIQFEAQAMASHTEEPDDPGLSQDMVERLWSPTFGKDDEHTRAFDGEKFWGHAVYASLEHDGRHLFADLDYWEYSPTFRAENGYEPRNNRRRAGFSSYYVFQGEGLVTQVLPQFYASRVWNFDGRRKDEWIQTDLSIDFSKAQTGIHSNYLRSRERFRGADYDGIWAWHTCMHSTPASWLRMSGNVNYGHRIARGAQTMGRQWDYGFWVEIKPRNNIEIDSSWSWVSSEDNETGEQLFEGYVMRTRFGYQVNRELCTRVIVQYNDFRETWEVDPMVSYKINPLTIFYLGSTRDYREYSMAEDGLEGWELSDRQYFMKLQYLFQI